MRVFVIRFWQLAVILVGGGCSSDENGNGKNLGPEAVYFDYKIWGDEQSGEVVVRLQYRQGGPAGTTLVLNEPAGVKLDGEELPVDSSKFNGAYYEVIKPAVEFAGEHEIRFTGSNGKEYVEAFEFFPIRLETHLGDSLARSDLNLEIRGAGKKNFLRIVMTDTAMFSEGLVKLDTLTGNTLQIKRAELDRLADGPIHFRLYREEDRAVKNGTREGGRISLTWELASEFVLKTP